MGVLGSYCQLCRLPLQHDHYVPTADGSLKIYRGAQANGGHEWGPDEMVVRFGPEHTWLADVVGLPRTSGGAVLRGTVTDGVLADARRGVGAFIADGDDEASAYHAACWELVFSPVNADDALRGHGTFGWAAMETYGGQLFELVELVAHGHGWALVDPRGTSEDARRSRARIHAILAQARRVPASHARPRFIRDILTTDRNWRGEMLRDDTHAPLHAIHYRGNLHRGLDCTRYPNLVWGMKEYGQGMPSPEAFTELAVFEAALKAAVEADEAAILVMTTIGDGQGQFLVYARDEDQTCGRIDTIWGGEHLMPVLYDNEADPAWNVFFEQMDPHRQVGAVAEPDPHADR